MKSKLSKMFFGWWIVAAAFLINFIIGGTILYGFTTIFEPIASEMGWSYAQISFAASLRGLELGLFAPIMGIIIDRWGPRKLIFVSLVFAAGGSIFLSNATSLAMFYGAFIVMGIGMSGCTGAVMLTAIANWFKRRIGLAGGIAASGLGLSGLLIPLVVRLVDTYDWRMAMTIIAISLLVITLPLSLVFRHKPEHYSYAPDGETVVEISNAQYFKTETTESDLTTRQAMRSGVFWRIALAQACLLTGVVGVTTHVMPYLSSIGMTRSVSSLVAMFIPVISIGGRIGLGWLGDRFRKNKVAAMGFAMVGLGLLCFIYSATVTIWLLVAFLILYGIGYGGGIILCSSMVREYFGREKFGVIYGMITGIAVLGAMSGPLSAGWVFDITGSYRIIWFVFVGLAVVATASVFNIYAPVNKTASKH